MVNATIKGQLYVISAPSGAGKTSLVNALCKNMDNLCISVSHTTRALRKGEKKGKNYHFVSVENFRKMMSQNELLEHAEVFGNFYGTSKDWVQNKQAQGYDIILELDWQGAQQIRKQVPAAVSIFILPPSQKELLRRLEARGTDSKEVVNYRMTKATSEISHFNEFDYLIVNNDFNVALSELITIIKCHRLTREQQNLRYTDLISELLS